MLVRRLSVAIAALAALAAVPGATSASANQPPRAGVPRASIGTVGLAETNRAGDQTDIRYGALPAAAFARPLAAAPTARELSVTVSARPTIVKPMERMHLTGVVGPRAGGAVVTVQAKAGAWQAIPGAQTTADPLGRYAIDVWSKRGGTFSLRVVGALGNSSGISKLVTMRVS